MPAPPGPWRQMLPWPATADATTSTPTRITATANTPRQPHTRFSKRDLSDGAVAGVAVGMVVLGLLLALCLYPVIVGFLKRRQRDKRLRQQRLDDEAALSGPTTADGVPPRLSSSESLKHSGTLTRGYDRDVAAAPVPREEGIPDPDPALLDFAQCDQETARGAVEYMPQDLRDDQPGVLKGTSEDYYRTSIPSSAFGMVDQPATAADPSTRTASRASSFSNNVRHMFRRKSDRNQTLSSVGSSHHGDENGATPLQRIITAEEPMADSPTQMSPRSTPPPHTPGLRALPATTSRGLSAEPPSASLSNASSPRALLKSPSPPHDPAPGTVNPMDIMAPSTESELWHRTEHQLFASSHESPPPQHLQPPADLDHLSPGSSNPASSPSVQVSSANDDTPEQPKFSQNDVDMGEENLLHTGSANNAGRHPSFPSEHSTPLPGPAFTDVSSQNTPSTQLDTPSPDSRNSSDFRHSVSPGLVANHVPSPVKNQDGMYHCDEPGCTQSFDQPHKLKHHQRYHSKDHKCTYPGCGKGFGTKTHLQRHINDRHEKKKKFHCSIDGCDYSRIGGRAFPRKDNWKRHMIKIHSIEQGQLPQPVEVDAEMTGV